MQFLIDVQIRWDRNIALCPSFVTTLKKMELIADSAAATAITFISNV